jgi:hypothetical protein
MKPSIKYTLSLSLALSLFTGCTSQPNLGKTISVDPTLPTPSLNGSLSDIDSAAFEWKAIDNEKVTGYYVYRSGLGENNETLTRIATLNSRYTTHYIDEKLSPNTAYLYRFASSGANNTESIGSETLTVTTQPMIAPVSYFQTVGNMPRSAKLLWRPHPSTRINSYAIERLNINDQTWSKIATVEGRLNAEYIDTDLTDGQVYYYRIRAITFDNLSTVPSETSKVTVKPLPPEIKTITATTTIPKAIDLAWTPSTITDLSYYNVYRSSSSNGPYDYYVKTTETRFTDKLKEDGEFYYYQVSAVDKDGLESLRGASVAQGSSLGRPQTPVSFDGTINANGANLQWSNKDPRIVSYTLVKKTKLNWLNSEILDINNIQEMSYHDTAAKPNTQYSYQVVGVDKDGVRSLPTQAIELEYEIK